MGLVGEVEQKRSQRKKGEEIFLILAEQKESRQIEGKGWH